MCLKNKPIFALGDLNDNLFEKGNHVSKIIKSLNLKQVIDKPTRITEKSSTLIDVAIANKMERIIKTDILPSPIADHEIISIIVNVRKPKPKPEIRTSRSIKILMKINFTM